MLLQRATPTLCLRPRQLCVHASALLTTTPSFWLWTRNPGAHPSHVPQVEPFLDHAITRHYLSDAGVPNQGGKIIAEYVWIGGTGQDLRSKVNTCTGSLAHWTTYYRA